MLTFKHFAGGLFLGCSFLIVGYLGVCIGENRGKRRPIALINDELVTQTDLDEALSVYRLQALDELAEIRLVNQWAKREKITATREEITPGHSASNYPPENKFLEARARNTLLWKKLIVKLAGEETRQKIYRDFLPELRQYAVSVVIFGSEPDYQNFQSELAQKADFGSLARKYSVDSATRYQDGKLEGYVTLPTIRDRFGPYAADALHEVKPGQMTPLFNSPYGPMILQVRENRDQFADLAPLVDDILVKGRRPMLNFKLYQDAHISSDLIPGRELKIPGSLQTPAETLPTPKKGPDPVDSTLPKPNLSGTPAPNSELPKLELNRPIVPGPLQK